MNTYYNIHTHTPSTAHPSVVNLYPWQVEGVLPPAISISWHPMLLDRPKLSYPTASEWHHLLTQPQVIALGECGLDRTLVTSIEQQEAIFIQQIALSELYEKPLIIHCVRTYDRLLYLKKQINPQQPWVVHGFRGNPTLAMQLQRGGIYLSLGERFNEQIVTTITPELLFVESDESHCSIEGIYSHLAQVWGKPLEWLCDEVERSVKRVFLQMMEGF